MLRQAEARSRELDLARLFDPRPALRRLAGALALGCICALLVAQSPASGRTFFARFFLLGGAWPRETTLAVWIEGALFDPQALPGEDIERQGQLERTRAVEQGRHTLRAARGSDLTLVVQAQGKTPRAVEAHFGEGRFEPMSQGSLGTFRLQLRALQQRVELFVVGGDDQDREPSFDIEVLDAPDVAALCVRVTPPAYTGLAPRVEQGGNDLSVPAGTQLEIVMRPEPADSKARVRLLPADLLRDLEPRAWLADEASTPSPQGLGFELLAEQSLRFRFELESPAGLTNPQPGLYAIEVRPDRPPQVEWLAPTRGEVEQLVGGALRLAARAQDDYAVGSIELRLSRPGTSETSLGRLPFEPTPSEPSGGPASTGTAGRETWRGENEHGVSAGLRVEIRDLLGPLAEQQGEPEPVELALEVADQRPQEAGRTRSTPVRVRIVSADDFMRRLQDRLARVRTQAAQLEALQREKRQRARELRDALDAATSQDGAVDAGLAAVAAGQRRAAADADELLRELSAALESVLYARIDPAAAQALETLDRELARAHRRGFQLEAWRALNAEIERAPPKPGLCSQLAPLVGRALDLVHVDNAGAVLALDRAQSELQASAQRAALEAALAHQEQAERRLAEIVERLAEWDNFQSVLSLTREILSRQKTIKERLTQSPPAAPSRTR